MTYKEFLQNGGESRWQKKWLKDKIDRAEDFDKKPKKYVLDMFPYPSGAGLHVGHPEGYTATDIFCRYLRLKGFNVLHPMGWDAFGLPAENYAISTGTQPAKTTAENIKVFKRQIQSLGFSYDWDREIDTTDPKYYKWTQWIFLQLFKKGLAYEATVPINFCPSCQTGLANEEVSGGQCQRCGTTVERKDMRQWMLKITAYADRLLVGVDKLDWPESIKTLQRNWIGRSEGAEVTFEVKTENVIPSEAEGETEGSLGNKRDSSTSPESRMARSGFGWNDNYKIKVYTTRPDTLFGATYMVLSPEHPLIKNLELRIKNIDEVNKYIAEARNKSDLERTELNKEKTGVELKGIKAINPVNNAEIPIWISDYVLASYGTGAIMAVPAHDDRDYEFAKKFNLPIIEVIKGGDISKEAYTDIDSGIMVNSEFLNGLAPAEAIGKMTKWLEEKGCGQKAVNYKLRDWVFSRQRYWGEPIPLVFCEKCKSKVEKILLNNSSPFIRACPELAEGGRLGGGNNGNTPPQPSPYKGEGGYDSGELLNPGWIALSEKDLPLTLPKVDKYKPTGTGESPLANIKDWLETKCPKCGGPARRETNTMPQWAGSSWYWLRFIDPQNKKELAGQKKLKYWLPVDLYLGGAEHAVLHLLYARFWNMVLFDIGVAPQAEPFTKLVNQGLILGEDNEKMSKSRGNVVNPDDILKEHGADGFRLYEMFMGPLQDVKPWNTQGIIGIDRFLEKVWRYNEKIKEENKTKRIEMKDEAGLPIVMAEERLLYSTIKKVGEDIEKMKFNTAISALMIFMNGIFNAALTKEEWGKFLIILSPFAPHLAEELWQKSGQRQSIFKEAWPKYDESKVKDEQVEIAVQVNGKLRAAIMMSAAIGEADAAALAQADGRVAKYLVRQNIKKTIFVKNKLINFVV